MGVIKWFSSSSFDSQLPGNQNGDEDKKSQNPNPKRYSVKRMHKKGDFLILKINYPDCTNYEGNKILVYKGCTMVELAQQESIDPHFSDSKEFHSPIARFRPDDEGWKMAEFFVENLK
jgi:hypothetical protein